MKNIKAKSLTFFLISMFSVDSFSFVATQRSPIAQMRETEDCGTRSRNGRASQLGEIADMLHQAAWYQDRDNSMTPVSTDEGVGAAMGIFMTLNGYTQGIQVCPGVYLATAHGVLDDPADARNEGRAVRSPLDNSVRVIGYPMHPDNMMRARDSESQFVSPRLRDPSTWSDPTTDYVFVTVDNPIRPNDFVRPVRSSDQRLIEASNSGEMDVHLYRPQTRFNTDADGVPDFNNQTWADEVNEIAPLYQAPLRVDQACSLNRGVMGTVGTNCPNEQAVSGSSNVTNINGQDYLVGLEAIGLNTEIERFEGHEVPNSFIQSSHFCEDYESVCGQPCVELDEVLPQNDDGVSI